MNKTIKNAMALGKAMRAEREKTEAEAAAKRQVEAQKKEAERQDRLLKEAKRHLDEVPGKLSKAVADGKTSFSLFSRNVDDGDKEYSELCKIIEPALKKMGLTFKHSSGSHYVYMTFDPDTGYDAHYYELEVIVPEEDKLEY